MHNYDNLVTLLDQIKREAPMNNRFYHNTDSIIQDQARSRSLIHLFLKAKFGLLTFEQRDEFITDGPLDGGIDGYYIDNENKKIYFIQSKFRTTAQNFESKNISAIDILKMDIENITKGNQIDANKKKYNDSIQKLIKKLQNIDGLSRYDYVVILLANVEKITSQHAKKIIGNHTTEVYDYKKIYSDLVFPVASGNFYNVPDLYIELDLNNKYSSNRISYQVKLKKTVCDITVLFVPTIEIAKTLYKYKNTILRYNPRSYLDLRTNKVNQEIQNTILSTTTNEFALFNNGLTILSDETKIKENIGRGNLGQLFIKNPQIINGGQTAYTLSKVFADNIDNQSQQKKLFKGKEVIVKVITFPHTSNNKHKDDLIEDISKATNQQSPIIEADRRSNDAIQLRIQKEIFNDFGYYYERKNGEFYDGIINYYVKKDKIIDRESFMRIALSIQGNVSNARSKSTKEIFSLPTFNTILSKEIKSKEIFFGYLVYRYLNDKQKNSPKKDKFYIARFGNALRYGKYAIISIVVRKLYNASMDCSTYEKHAKQYTDEVLNQWLDFEKAITKQKSNKDYFATIKIDEGYELNYDGYYKGKTINKDLVTHFNL
jgi:hypothetical protein